MPLLLIVGLPCTGKTTRARQIVEYFKEICNKSVKLVSENEVVTKKNIDKNNLVFDAQKEKEIRGTLKSDMLRSLGRDNVVILDASNYIKGYRYELYCATKNSKTTQVTVECLANQDDAWTWNTQRDKEERYTREAFDALIMRYEAPDSRNRWDSPLISLHSEDTLNGEQLNTMLFSKKPPPPNMSTQSAPLAETSFLYELDRVTQEVVNAILEAKNLGLSGEVKLGTLGEDCRLSSLPETVSPAQLARHRRQFLSYTKLHPPPDQKVSPHQLAVLFLHFLNTVFSSS